MDRKGFKIYSCDCGEILIQLGDAKKEGFKEDAHSVEILAGLKDDEKYCPACDKIVKN